MPHILFSHGHELDFDALYARLWQSGEVDDDGSRVYTSAGEQSLKWLIAELAGTPAESGRTLPANNDLRRQVHAALLDGLAERVNERRFRLLVSPAALDGADGAAAPGRVAQGGVDEGTDESAVVVTDPDDDGTALQDVDASSVTSQDDRLTLGGCEWSAWTSLSEAAASATTSPGVYTARSEGQLVYVGMAGERRGQGVRGRLRVYARGRGAVSGLGEAALDRALADPAWVRERLAQLESGGPERATAWARAAFARRPMEVAWSARASAEDARAVEESMLVELEDADLWNRARPRRT